MKKPNLKDYAITKEDGTSTYDFDKYEKDLQSYLDDERRIASETAKAKGVAEGKKKAEEEAKLSEEERVQKALEEQRKALKDRELELNKREIKAIYKEAGYDEEEISNLLLLVNEDLDQSTKVAQTFASSRKKFVENKEKEIIQKYQIQQPNPNGTQTKGSEKTWIEKIAEDVPQPKGEGNGSIYDNYK